ncbi:fungal-specific transcription factor domain-containing protein [Zychaea mexicana]|uniref:fungal-specific transcription factor domain-containing protein n=1 Tax=Zychaea mexicana TaxID=64656 RepID=UPI0022FE7C4D|nr:fungal-specific transcription factor domain-containing protein [Zychaea mexicana]KAI9493991.1 fungal-specific transcription factor domain-containing protein [Zychaea mexicana]
MADENHSAKRQRVSKACDQCRRKKVKCDGTLPQCSNCKTVGLECKYNETNKKRGPPKGYIEAIEGRLQRLEALLSSVVQEDDPRSQAIMAELNAPLHTPYGELVRPRLLGRGFNEPEQPSVSGPSTPSSTASSPIAPRHQQPSQHQQQQRTQQALNENNDTLGSQYTDGNSPVRYYGKSSGYYMLRDSKNYRDGVFRFNSQGYCKGSNNDRLTSVKALLSLNPYELPPKDLSKHLIDLYFEHYYPFLPILHKNSFLASLDSQDSSVQPAAPLLLNSIYALASRISPDPRVRADPNLPDTAGDIFFERARLLLDNEWENFTVSTVQSLILLSSHQTGAMKTVRGWLYSGLAFRMLQNLGLNRNCDKWKMSDIEKENRKRSFFCCFVVDRLACAMFGRTPIIDERDYDTPFPTAIDEDDPSVIDNFHQLIKLCGTLGSVLRQLYTVYGRHQLSVMATPDRVISALDKELNGWMAKLPLSVLYRPPNTRAGDRAPAPSLERCQLHMLFYTTLILLHRLFIPGRCHSVTPSVFPAGAICTYAANKILDISISLMEEERLNHVNCYALYFMFTAGTIFINDASSPDSNAALEAKINVNRIMRAMEQVETTWKTSARHSNILGELAGLRDINLEEGAGAQEDRQLQRQQQQQQVLATPAAIAVPTSPILGPAAAPSRSMPSSSTAPSYSTAPVSSTAAPAPYQSTTSYSDTKLPETPVSIATSTATPKQSFDYEFPFVNAYDSASAEQKDKLHQFDPNNMAFWGVPTSFDVEEWNNYLNNQNFQQPPEDGLRVLPE